MSNGFLALIATGTALIAGASSASGSGSIDVIPSTLEVSTFFSGATVRVEGTAPQSDGLAVVLSGSSETQELKRKGKVWGVLWMNVGEVSFDQVPSVYMVASSDPLCELAPYDVRTSLRLGEDVLAEASVSAEGDEDGARLFGELVKLKEQEGLYRTGEGTLEVVARNEEGWRYSGSFELPARVPEGTYTLVLWSFDDGKATELATAELRVAEVGVIREIADFAMSHGLLYGVFAVIIALAAGLLTGFLFGMAGKGGH